MELPATFNAGRENDERGIVAGESISPLSNTGAPSNLMPENTSTLGTLRMVCLVNEYNLFRTYSMNFCCKHFLLELFGSLQFITSL